MAVNDYTQTKQCTKCKEVKQVSNFGKQLTRKDGYRPWCKKCTNDAINKQRHIDWNKTLEKSRERYYLTIEYQKSKHAIYRLNNHEKCKQASLDYKNNNVEIYNARARQWAKDNPERHRAHRAKRRAVEAQAMPIWYEASLVIEIYQKAKQMELDNEIKYHIDHIVPLQNELVCGLHVADNLRIITAFENRQKGNRYWPNMP